MPIEPDVVFAYMNDEGKLVIHSKSIGLHLYMIAPGLGSDSCDCKPIQAEQGALKSIGVTARQWGGVCDEKEELVGPEDDLTKFDGVVKSPICCVVGFLRRQDIPYV
ncbi:MAG: hypothetical protein ACI8PB_004906 [Desulforhopalus sp.]|jgi:hypothetical protein